MKVSTWLNMSDSLSSVPRLEVSNNKSKKGFLFPASNKQVKIGKQILSWHLPYDSSFSTHRNRQPDQFRPSQIVQFVVFYRAIPVKEKRRHLDRRPRSSSYTFIVKLCSVWICLPSSRPLGINVK